MDQALVYFLTSYSWAYCFEIHGEIKVSEFNRCTGFLVRQFNRLPWHIRIPLGLVFLFLNYLILGKPWIPFHRQDIEVRVKTLKESKLDKLIVIKDAFRFLKSLLTLEIYQEKVGLHG